MNMKAAKPKKIETNDRSMSVASDANKDMFFFPKRKPPISVRATSLEEAQSLVEAKEDERLETPNTEEHD